MSLLLKKVERPRELTWYQASSMLYGDWGTSKAYVLGLAFAISGHASFFFLLAMSVLTTLVGYCYVIICRVYPDGGGVYSSLRNRSRTFAVLGALLLVADYVITASLSSLSTFQYLGWPHPELFAIGALIIIGAMNVLGPAKSGSLATVIAVLTVGVLLILCMAVMPHLTEVKIVMPEGPVFDNWTKFVGIVLALSGVEAIANSTGIMKEPVGRTSRRAIMPVMLEVCVVSIILGAAMNAIPGLEGRTGDMIRAIAEHYVGGWFGVIVGFLMGLLLLSACNTAIMDLVSITFLMAKDKELPSVFGRLNRFGMPWCGLLVATAMPIVVLLVEHDLEHLAALYAIGVVGAITLNLGATAINKEVAVKKPERFILGFAAAIMFLIELTVIYEKHHAVVFASCILVVGFLARSTSKWFEARRIVVPEVLGISVLTLEEARDLMPLYKGSTLVAIKAVSQSLIDEASIHAKGKDEEVVYTLYVEEKPPGWAYPTEVEPSEQAVKVLNEAYLEFEKRGITAVPLWQLAEDAAGIIVKTSKELGLDTVMIGTTKRGALERMMKGEVLKRITEQLPAEKHLVICN